MKHADPEARRAYLRGYLVAALFSKLSRTTDRLSFRGQAPTGRNHSPGFPPKPRQPPTKPAFPKARRPASPTAGALLPRDNRSLCHWVTLSLCRLEPSRGTRETLNPWKPLLGNNLQ